MLIEHLPVPSRLNFDARMRFERDGFVAMPGVIPPGELPKLRELYEALFAPRAGYERGDFFDMPDPEDTPEPARNGAETPWHQDDACVTVGMPHRTAVSGWIALQDTNEEMGCMHYVPGTRLGALARHAREAAAMPEKQRLERRLRQMMVPLGL